jgi:proline racemase
VSRYRTIDAKVAGDTIRLLVGGGPTVEGATIHDKRAWLIEHGDALRRALTADANAHDALHVVLFTEPASPETHAGLLFMNAAGFPRLSGEAVMAATTIGIDEKIIYVNERQLVLDTPAGVLTGTPLLGMDATDGVGGMKLTGLPGWI